MGAARRVDLWGHFLDREKIGLDSPVLIYYLNEQAPHFPLCEELLKRIESGHLRAVMSVVSEMEALSAYKVAADVALVNDVEQLLRRLTRLEIVPVDRTIARRAARLRAECRLKGLDSLIATTAIVSGCRYIVGNDREFAERVSDIDYLVLDDYI